MTYFNIYVGVIMNKKIRKIIIGFFIVITIFCCGKWNSLTLHSGTNLVVDTISYGPNTTLDTGERETVNGVDMRGQWIGFVYKKDKSGYGDNRRFVVSIDFSNQKKGKLSMCQINSDASVELTDKPGTSGGTDVTVKQKNSIVNVRLQDDWSYQTKGDYPLWGDSITFKLKYNNNEKEIRKQYYLAQVYYEASEVVNGPYETLCGEMVDSNGQVLYEVQLERITSFETGLGDCVKGVYEIWDHAVGSVYSSSIIVTEDEQGAQRIRYYFGKYGADVVKVGDTAALMLTEELRYNEPYPWIQFVKLYRMDLLLMFQKNLRIIIYMNIYHLI